MVYTNSVPQANQQISATQAPILQNFEFIQEGIGTEHNFNAAGSGNDMYHNQTSMPNQALLAAFPVAATNGVYYVNDGIATFFDGTLNYPLNPFCLRAAVNFLGGPPVSINSSYNVTSVTPGTVSGQPVYTIAFTNPMPSANYIVLAGGERGSQNLDIYGFVLGSSQVPGSVGSPIQMASVTMQFSSGTSLIIPKLAYVMVFGG